ncbi:MAG: flagellar basal body P-ring protein FlgI [Pirellulaceae bacterium]
MQSNPYSFCASRFALIAILQLALSGCISPWFRPNDDPATRREAIREKLESDERPRIISQIGTERMLTLARLENVGLVTQLPGTGGVVNASQPREKMLDIMRRRDADQPNTFLDSDATAMVVAYAIVPPAAAKGRILDVNVKMSSHAEATDLQRGWLLDTSLVEMRNESGQVREGFEYAVAKGPLVTRAQIYGGDSPDDKLEGIVVGGAQLLKTRELGIGIQSDFADAITMAAILPAINNRFTIFDGRKQVGIATPQDDNDITVAVPARYRLDPFHFINVVLNVGFNELEPQRMERIEQLKLQLNDPVTVRTASWQLEAIGEEAIPILANNLTHPDPEVRFYTAHALAYLGDPRAIAPLVELCRREPAFRAMCLNALTIIESYEAGDALEQLLHAADTETRYGALRALRQRDASDPRATGLPVSDVGTILEVPTAGPPLVAISLHERPEIAIFGPVPQLHLPLFSYVNPRIIIQPNGDRVTISNFETGKEDRVTEVAGDLRSVLVGIAEVGGNYGDWVSFLRVCHEKGYLSEPLAINPIPTAGRTYHREPKRQVEPGEEMYEQTLINELESPSTASKSSWYNPFSW